MLWPSIAGLCARMRRYRLLTSGLLPVAHEFSRTSTPGWSGSEFSPVEPEWPSTAIEFGYPLVHLRAVAVADALAAGGAGDALAAVAAGLASEPPQPVAAAAVASNATTAIGPSRRLLRYMRHARSMADATLR